LAGSVVPGPRHPPSRLGPQFGDGVLVADDHPGAAARRHVGEASAVSSGRHDVRADVAQRVELVSGGEGAEPTEAAPRDVLQEDALDRIGRAEL
jgi:hypothetical protein